MKKFLCMLMAFFLPIVCGAADVSFVSPPDIRAGDEFTVEVRADTDGESINAVDLAIDYDDEILSFEGYRDSRSMIKFWVRSPAVENGKIILSGIIPGGVSAVYDADATGEGIPLVTLLFTANRTGTALLSFEQSVLFKNDGTGSVLPHEKENAELHITDTASGITFSPDTIPPKPFAILFVPSAGFSSNASSLIAFDAKDAESGIRGYELKVGRGPWKTAENPTLVSKGILPRTVTVRAYDNAGNFRDASADIPGLFHPLWVVLALVVFASILVRKLLSY